MLKKKIRDMGNIRMKLSAYKVGKESEKYYEGLTATISGITYTQEDEDGFEIEGTEDTSLSSYNCNNIPLGYVDKKQASNIVTSTTTEQIVNVVNGVISKGNKKCDEIIKVITPEEAVITAITYSVNPISKNYGDIEALTTSLSLNFTGIRTDYYNDGTVNTTEENITSSVTFSQNITETDYAINGTVEWNGAAYSWSATHKGNNNPITSYEYSASPDAFNLGEFDAETTTASFTFTGTTIFTCQDGSTGSVVETVTATVNFEPNESTEKTASRYGCYVYGEGEGSVPIYWNLTLKEKEASAEPFIVFNDIELEDDVEATQPDNELWYRLVGWETNEDNSYYRTNICYPADDGIKIATNNGIGTTGTFGIGVKIVDHYYDGTNKRWVIKCDNPITKVSSRGMMRIDLDNDQKEIYGDRFDGQSLEQVWLPNTIKKIEIFGFWDQNSLLKINFPRSLENIDASRSFENSHLLGLEKFNRYNNRSYTIYCSYDRLFPYLNIESGNTDNLSLRSMPGFFTKKVVIPKSIKNFGEYGLWDCTYDRLGIFRKNKYDLVFPDKLEQIGFKTLYCGNVITSLTINSGLTTTDTGSTWGHLKKLTFAEGRTELVQLNQFKDEFSVDELVLPSTLTALTYLPNCKKLNIPSQITEIPTNCFSGNTLMEEIEIPEGVTKIKDYAFSNTVLTSITLPSTITEIGNQVFNNSYNLCKVIIKATTPPTFGYSPFNEDYTSPYILYVPKGCISSYKAVWPWANICEIDGESNNTNNDVTKISDYAYVNSEMSNFTIPSNVTYVGVGSFAFCKNLKKVIINSNNIQVDRDAFYGCESLETIEFNGIFNSLGKRAFYKCKSLNINNEWLSNLGSINYSFNSCDSITGLTLSDNLTEIKSGAFKNCACLTKLDLTNTKISVITDNVFADSGLKVIKLPSTLNGKIVGSAFNTVEIMAIYSETPPELDNYIVMENMKKIYVPDNVVNEYKSKDGWSYFDEIIFPLSQYSEEDSEVIKGNIIVTKQEIEGHLDNEDEYRDIVNNIIITDYVFRGELCKIVTYSTRGANNILCDSLSDYEIINPYTKVWTYYGSTDLMKTNEKHTFYINGESEINSEVEYNINNFYDGGPYSESSGDYTVKVMDESYNNLTHYIGNSAIIIISGESIGNDVISEDSYLPYNKLHTNYVQFKVRLTGTTNTFKFHLASDTSKKIECKIKAFAPNWEDKTIDNEKNVFTEYNVYSNLGFASDVRDSYKSTCCYSVAKSDGGTLQLYKSQSSEPVERVNLGNDFYLYKIPFEENTSTYLDKTHIYYNVPSIISSSTLKYLEYIQRKKPCHSNTIYYGYFNNIETIKENLANGNTLEMDMIILASQTTSRFHYTQSAQPLLYTGKMYDYKGFFMVISPKKNNGDNNMVMVNVVERDTNDNLKQTLIDYDYNINIFEEKGGHILEINNYKLYYFLYDELEFVNEGDVINFCAGRISPMVD